MSLVTTATGTYDDSTAMATPVTQNAPLRQPGLSASATIETFTTPAGAHKQKYRYSVEVRVSALSAGTLQIQVAYTDASGGAQTLTLSMTQMATGTAVTTINANGEYVTTWPVDIECGPGTTVTLKTVVTPTLTYAIAFTRDRLASQ